MADTAGILPDSPPQSDPRLNLEEAAQLLQVSEKTMTRWIAELDLPHTRSNEQVPSFDRAEVIEWANQHSFRLAADVPGESDSPLPMLSAAVSVAGIHRAVGASHIAAGGKLDVDRALHEVAHALPLPKLVDRPFFHQVLLAREDLGSTGIGHGIATPHVRAPLVLHVDHPMVGIFFLARPIDWSAIDAKPVETLFVVVSPGVRAHLHLLSRISFALRDGELQRMLVERAPNDLLLQRLRQLETGQESAAAES